MNDMTASGDFLQGKGEVKDVNIFDRYVSRILKDYRGCPLDIAWDPGNGAAGEVTKAVIAKLQDRHILINDEIDGTFPNHHPDPTVEENLEQIRAIVAKEKLDLGIAFDGDGDRVGVIDSKGRIVWRDQLLCLLAEEVLEELPGSTIIADIKAS